MEKRFFFWLRLNYFNDYLIDFILFNECVLKEKKININFVKKNVLFYCVKLVVLDKLLKWKSSIYF